MKKTSEPKRIKKGAESAVALIVSSFLKWNLICLGIILVGYIICYLYALQDNNFYFTVREILTDLINEEVSEFICRNSLILVLPAFLLVFIVNCTVYSFSTLINFGRLYKSLDAFISEEEEIRSFPKSFSEIEIKLSDVHLKVVENRRKAIEAEKKKDDLVMYLAHDLKTPLTSVIGYLTLLDECRDIPTEQRAKFVGISLEKAYRLEQLINEFFEITRFNINKVTLEKNRIDLNMMLEQMTDEFYPMLSEKNLTVSIDIPEHIVMFADSDKIARVFDNLLKNAVTYAYNDTEIKIGARIRRNKVLIKFRNKCDEIPPEKLNRLFEKFYRIDSSRTSSTGGSGLGLSIAKQLTELHGGTIHAKSITDYTDFTVVLPYINAEELTNEQLEF